VQAAAAAGAQGGDDVCDDACDGADGAGIIIITIHFSSISIVEHTVHDARAGVSLAY
jgi:hypothetical protein